MIARAVRSRARCCVPWMVGAAASCAAGCQDPLTDPAVIAGPRIVAARVRAESNPAVAEPAAGASASIDWLVLSDAPGPYLAQVVWCRAAPSVLGAPRCEGPAFDERSATGQFGEAITLGFRVPEELAEGRAWLVWIGICGDGAPALFDAEQSSFLCPDGAALSGFYRGFVPGATPNENPSLLDDAVALDGAEWLAPGEPAPPEQGCRDRGLPALVAGERSRVSFALGGDDREALQRAIERYAAHERESLVYTHLSSHPGLERAFSAIDFDADELGFEVAFEPGDVAPDPEGETLRFYLFVRDERGGVDWLEREACLLPE